MLAKPVFDLAGRMLLNSGVELSAAYLESLREHGVSEVWVNTPEATSVAPEDAVSDASRIQLAAAAHASMLAMQEGQALPAAVVHEAAEGVSDDIRRRRGMTVAVTAARSEREYWPAHARNVALLTIATLRVAGLGATEAVHAGVGALLHDIGLVRPEGDAAAALQHECDGAGRQHPVAGFERLLTESQFSARAAVICLQHHERRDGSGFPKGLRDDRVNFEAQACAAADEYDLLIAPPPFGRGVTPHVALAALRVRSDVAAPRIMDCFRRAVAPYAPGAALRLRDGATAVVTEPMAAGAMKVQVRIIAANGQSVAEMDLAGDDRDAIAEVL